MFEGQLVIVRSPASGVWLGELVSVDDAARGVTLRAAQKIWRWRGKRSHSPSHLALYGLDPHQSAVAPAVDVARVYDVCEILSATPEAALAIRSAEKWTP